MSLKFQIRFTLLIALSAIVMLTASAHAQFPRIAMDAARDQANKAKFKPPTRITAVKETLIGRKTDLTVRPHPPTELAVKGKRVEWANLDYYIRYEVTFENRGPYATLGDRYYQLITIDSNGSKKVCYTRKFAEGWPPNTIRKAGSIQIDINSKLLWAVVLDGKDKNGWNDFIILTDNR